MRKEKCCGTCKWHHGIEDVTSRGRKVTVWECDNLDSDNYADLTDYDYCCEDWEERE